MRDILQKITCPLLAAAITCASFGCASQPTVSYPTPATVGHFVHYGDPVTVVKKSGEEEKFTTWVITPTAIGSGRNTPIAYDDMREIRKERIDGGSTWGDIKQFGNDMTPSEKSVETAGKIALLAPIVIAGFVVLAIFHVSGSPSGATDNGGAPMGSFN